jgi:ABC-type nickel/cobalt efflux system permease component RcnA
MGHPKQQGDEPHEHSLALRHAFRQSWLLAVFATISIMALLAVVLLAGKQFSDSASQRRADQRSNAQSVADLKCIGDWATAQTTRAQQIQDAQQIRTDALNKLAQLALTPGTPQKVIDQAKMAYLKASTDYLKQIERHPIPPPPQFTCLSARTGGR